MWVPVLAWQTRGMSVEDGDPARGGTADAVPLNFFISYAGADYRWAEWIAWQLEAAGYTVVLQAWDFKVGAHFVGEMNRAMEQAERTMLLLSGAYLRSTFAAEEWQAAWASDPDGRRRQLVAVRIEDCDRPGLLRQLVSVDLFGLEQDTARQRLLAAVTGERGKPIIEPAFPGGSAAHETEPAFPGLPQVWNVPSRLASFIGRTDLLERIKELLQQPETRGAAGPVVAVTALRGMGGVGKTQLAIEYAWRHIDDYLLVWWIDAEQSSLIGEKVAALASRLNLPSSGVVAEDAAAVLSQLARRERWLVIFDNAPSVEDIRPWLPYGLGHVLITSRSPLWGAVASRVDVDVLARHEAVALLQRRVPGLDEDTARELAEELGDLPLALAQAAAYLEQTEVAPQAYLVKFRSHRKNMLARGEDPVYGGRIDSTWSISLERLQNTAPATIQLLQLAAFCAPEPIPLTLFLGRPELLPCPLATVISGEDPTADLDDVVGAALDYSLCRRRTDTIQLHRLIQAVICSQLSSEQRTAVSHTVIGLLIAAHPGDPDSPATWPVWTALGPHILHLSTVANLKVFARLGPMVSQFCWHLFARGDYVGAHHIADSLYRSYTAAFGPDNKLTLSSAANLATILRSLGKLQESLELCEDTLARNRRIFGDDHLDTLHSENNLVSCLRAVSDLQAARKLGEDTLSHCQRILGNDHEHTLATAGNLAGALSEIGEYQAARKLAEDTLARHRQLFGNEHRETLWAASTLVEALYAQGDYSAARLLGEDTLARYRQLFGDDHPDTLNLATTLAAVLTALGEHELAQNLKHELPPSR
jgi:tetratricopeptide (TPR) repeat protein